MTLKTGTILYSSWGYDQTNIDFYIVVKASNKSVVLQAIGETFLGEDGFMTGLKKPDHNKLLSAPFRRKIQYSPISNEPVIFINSSENAYLLENETKRFNWYA